MWEELHRELEPQGVDIVTVCLDIEGREGARPDLEAVDGLSHTAVVDSTHALDALFGIVNVPMAVCLDEELRLIRPAEFAWPGEREGSGAAQLPDEIPERMIDMAATAAQITVDRDFFLNGIRDWAANGAASKFVLSPDEVIAASAPRGADESAAAAHFELGRAAHHRGDTDTSVGHFREAHRLDPGNWTYKRQAWELASRVEGPLARFWQGPLPGAEDEWPYEGDWLTDIKAAGPENYYPPHVG